jgi:hypothetical protein
MLIFVFATDSRWAWPFPRTGCALRALTATVMPLNGQVKTSRTHATRVQFANVEQLESTSTLLGLFKEWDCSMREQEFAPGDVLALYTDGVTEASNQHGKRRALPDRIASTTSGPVVPGFADRNRGRGTEF